MGSVIELRQIDDVVRAQMLALRLPPKQASHVGGSMAEIMADAEDYPKANPWPRAVYSHGEAVGFVMLSWNCEPDPPAVIGPWFLWKLVIDGRHQRKGLGARVVETVADIVRHEGATELLTSFVDEPDGPRRFYERLGFVPTGDHDDDGEVIASLAL